MWPCTHSSPWLQEGAGFVAQGASLQADPFLGSGLTHSLPLGRAAGRGHRREPRHTPMPPPCCSAPRPRGSQPAASAGWHSRVGHLGTKGQSRDVTLPTVCAQGSPWRGRGSKGWSPTLGHAELSHVTAMCANAVLGAVGSHSPPGQGRGCDSATLPAALPQEALCHSLSLQAHFSPGTHLFPRF